MNSYRGSIGQQGTFSRRTSHMSDTGPSTSTSTGIGRRRSIVTSESQDEAWTGDEGSSTTSSKHPSIAYPISFQVRISVLESQKNVNIRIIIFFF